MFVLLLTLIVFSLGVLQGSTIGGGFEEMWGDALMRDDGLHIDKLMKRLRNLRNVKRIEVCHLFSLFDSFPARFFYENILIK